MYFFMTNIIIVDNKDKKLHFLGKFEKQLKYLIPKQLKGYLMNFHRKLYFHQKVDKFLKFSRIFLT